MPKKGYKQTEEHKQKINITGLNRLKKGMPKSGTTRKNMSIAAKSKPRSQKYGS